MLSPRYVLDMAIFGGLDSNLLELLISAVAILAPQKPHLVKVKRNGTGFPSDGSLRQYMTQTRHSAFGRGCVKTPKRAMKQAFWRVWDEALC
jgi:hypothetical protein